MVLPKPSFTFTIPSLHDDTLLDCRLYCEGHCQGPLQKGAIIAHPYAPLGGSCDDSVVDAVGGQLLKAGWIVGTFNFRGAANSKGKTSWTGKPELEDYVSFTGFMAVFLSLVQSEQSDEFGPAIQETSSQTRLLLGGYSYGSLILSHLPPVSHILSYFTAPAVGSAASEIRLRARHLSMQLAAMRPRSLPVSNHTPASGEHQRVHRAYGQNLSVVMGGDETPEHDRRRSRESGRLSLDTIPGKIIELSSRRKGSGEYRVPKEDSRGSEGVKMTIRVSQTALLLISPLLPPLSTGLAMGLKTNQKAKLLRHTSSDVVNHENILETYPTLAIYGDNDFFTSAKRLNQWATKLEQASHGTFHRHVVENAGHFWAEREAIAALKQTISRWVDEMERPFTATAIDKGREASKSQSI